MTTTEQRERVVAAAITPELRKKVVAAALKATPGPWNDSGHSVDDFDADCCMRMEWIPNGAADDDDELNANSKADGAFIAAANPSTILAYEAALEEAEGYCKATNLDLGKVYDDNQALVLAIIAASESLGAPVQNPLDQARAVAKIGKIAACVLAERERAETAEQALSALQQENERLREAAKLSEAKSDMLADSNYLAGVTAGWNAAQDGNPNEALAKIQNSRKGHIGAYRAALSRKDQAG